MGSQYASAVTIGSLAAAAAITALLLPSMRFGDAWSNSLVFVAPQLALLGLHVALPTGFRAQALAGLGLALLAVTSLFCLFVVVQPPENFMVVGFFWFALVGAAAASLVLRRYLAGKSALAAGALAFFVSLAGAAVSTGLFMVTV